LENPPFLHVFPLALPAGRPGPNMVQGRQGQRVRVRAAFVLVLKTIILSIWFQENWFQENYYFTDREIKHPG
jgi:hypothetical protein